MVISSFYNTAKNYAEKVRQEKPEFYKPDYSICLIMADDQEIFTGVTGISIAEGNVVPVPAETNALMQMIAANKPKAKQMVIFSFKDATVLKPCDDCIDMLLRADDENSKCEIALSPDSSDTAINLKAEATSVSAEFLESKPETEEAPALGAPAEFVSGFEFDAGNPFLDAESSEPVPEVKTIQDEAQQQAFGQQQMPMGGYAQQQMPMGGYAQQQMPMGGYAQQQMPMGGYAQQQMPMGGYAQQQMPMGGYAQQQVPMSGYAQQQMPAGGYAQQPSTGGYANGADKSVYISDVISAAAAGQYQPSPAVSKYATPGEEGGILKQRLASIFNDDDDEEGENSATMSKDDLKKQSKEMKKAAKMSAQFKKQF